MMYDGVTNPLTLSLSREGRGDALHQFYPLPLRESCGRGRDPALSLSKGREGEGEASRGRAGEAPP